MNSTTSVKQIANALRAAQNAIPPIVKTKTARVQMKQGGTYTYNYADLSDIVDILRPVLMEYGLSFVQDALEAQGGVRVSTRILHTSGEWIEFGPLFLPAGDTPQAFGSAITYARRYALTTAFGIAAEEDDDGQAGRPARQRTSGGPSSANPSSSSAVRSPQQGAPPEDTSSSDGEAGLAEPTDPPTANPAEPGGSVDPSGSPPVTTLQLLARAHLMGLTASKVRAIAKGLGIAVLAGEEAAMTTEQADRVIAAYLEMKEKKAKAS